MKEGPRFSDVLDGIPLLSSKFLLASDDFFEMHSSFLSQHTWFDDYIKSMWALRKLPNLTIESSRLNTCSITAASVSQSAIQHIWDIHSGMLFTT